MKEQKSYLKNQKGGRNFQTVLCSQRGFLISVAFALYNGALGLQYGSIWHGSICVYYLFLAAIRGILLSGAHKRDLAEGEKQSGRAAMIASVVLLGLNAALIVPISLMAKLEKPVNMGLVPAIAMAAYATYKITSASIHLKRTGRGGDLLGRTLRVVNFIDALLTIVNLQNTLIVVNQGSPDDAMRTLSIITSTAAWLVITAVSVRNLLKCRKWRA